MRNKLSWIFEVERLTRAAAWWPLVLVLAVTCLHAIHAQESAGDKPPERDAAALSKARAVGNKARKVKKFYTRQFDLGGLPSYQPVKNLHGTLRQWGDNYLADSGLMDNWEAEFRKFQPEFEFSDNLSSSAVAFPGLIAGVADLAPLGRQALWDELKGFEREGADEAGDNGREVVEITMATGSYDVRGWSFALGVFVNKDNPLTQLTLEQLDGIFGTQRTGGWHGLTWDPTVARGPEKNIRTWGQLGLKGEWADKPIHVYGYNYKYHFADEIDKKVLHGSSAWNENLRMYSNMAGLKADGSLTAAGEAMMHDLSADKYGIAYTGIPFLTPQTKALLLSRDGRTYVPLTLETVQDRSYPLTRDVFYYFRRERGKPVDPKIKAFLTYVLSRQGQEAIERDGKYLPLTRDEARKQLAKLQ